MLTTPTAAELANEELRPFIDQYMAGASGFDAVERSRIYRAASDFIGTALAGRNALYEHYYLASPMRTFVLAHHAAQRDGDGDLDVIDRVLVSKDESVT